MVTHEVSLIQQYGKRIVTIKNGSVISDTAHPEVAQAVVADMGVLNAPSGYYHVPTEDAEIEEFLQSYGNTEVSAELSPDPDAEMAQTSETNAEDAEKTAVTEPLSKV